MEGIEELGRRRNAVRERLQAALEADPRVVAAWLTGSDGRGEADEWSDFDLAIAVEDAAWDELAAKESPLIRVVGEPLLIQAGFPSDSIADGRFWLVVYPGPVAIDWNIGPATKATRPRASVLLLEREPVPLTPAPGEPSVDAVRDLAQKAIEFFWAMAPIALKYAGRGHTRLAVQQCELLRGAYERLWHVVHQPAHLFDVIEHNRPLPSRLDSAMPRFAATIEASSAVEVIDQFCARVEALHRDLHALGVEVPAAMPHEVASLAAIARVTAASGGARPDSGGRR